MCWEQYQHECYIVHIIIQCLEILAWTTVELYGGGRVTKVFVYVGTFELRV